jgi:hypothetical protein
LGQPGPNTLISILISSLIVKFFDYLKKTTFNGCGIPAAGDNEMISRRRDPTGIIITN